MGAEDRSVFGKLEGSDKNPPKKSRKKSFWRTAARTKALAKTLAIRQLAPVGRAPAIDALVATIAERGTEPPPRNCSCCGKSLRRRHRLFGRMLADNPRYNVEAAAQVAHAISVHKVAIEDDFYRRGRFEQGLEDVGAGHVGKPISAGLFLYICIDKDLLVNLGGDRSVANRALAALWKPPPPWPHRQANSFGCGRVLPSFSPSEAASTPRSLAVAFLKPVNGYGGHADQRDPSADRDRDNLDKVYGACADACVVMDATEPEGSLQAVIDFVKE